MKPEKTYRFERDNAKALMAVERDAKKRKILAERIQHYEQQLRRIEQAERATNE